MLSVLTSVTSTSSSSSGMTATGSVQIAESTKALMKTLNLLSGGSGGTFQRLSTRHYIAEGIDCELCNAPKASAFNECRQILVEFGWYLKRHLLAGMWPLR